MEKKERNYKYVDHITVLDKYMDDLFAFMADYLNVFGIEDRNNRLNKEAEIYDEKSDNKDSD